MKKNTLLMILSGTLGVAGLALCLISAFNDNVSRWVLTAGLACIAIGTFINTFFLIKKNKKDQ